MEISDSPSVSRPHDVDGLATRRMPTLCERHLVSCLDLSNAADVLARSIRMGCRSLIDVACHFLARDMPMYNFDFNKRLVEALRPYPDHELTEASPSAGW